MSEFLVIRLEATPGAPASWIAVDETGTLLSAVTSGSLDKAAAFGTGRRIVVLVPAAAVLRTRAEVPVKSGGKLMQALPFALEEQVADDVDELHFAAGTREVDGRLAVAVVRRETIDEWMQRLAAAGLEPDAMYAESDALGHTPNTATLLVQEDGAVLASPDGMLITMDTENVESLCELSLTPRQTENTERVPLHVVVYASPALLEVFTSRLERLRAQAQTLEFLALSDGPLPRLAARIVTTPGVDLLQGPYARRSHWSAWWPAWRATAALLVATLTLGLAVQWGEIHGLRREVKAIDTTIDQAFHHVFPDAGPITDPQAELSARLLQLGGQQNAGSREFMDTLAVLARALNADSRIRIEAFNYRPGTLDLRLRTPSVEALDQLQQSVSGTGTLQAQIQSANTEGDEVIGRLHITRSGS